MDHLAVRCRCRQNLPSWLRAPAVCSPTAPPCRPRKPRLSWPLRPATPATPRRGSRTRSPAHPPRFGARAAGPLAPRAALWGLLQGAEVPLEGGQARGGAPKQSTKASGTQPSVSPARGSGPKGAAVGLGAPTRPGARAHRGGHRPGRPQAPARHGAAPAARRGRAAGAPEPGAGAASPRGWPRRVGRSPCGDRPLWEPCLRLAPHTARADHEPTPGFRSRRWTC
jgi:hypothetical protein